MKVRKAVIPAAGFGTRMLPITSAVPKELLPVCGRPVIEHVVTEAVQAGIEEVILVLSEAKRSVADYFKPNRRLETRLLKTGQHDALRQLEEIWNLAKVSVVIQQEQRGLGDAVLCAQDAVGNEPFGLLLGDCIVHTANCGSFTKELIDSFQTFERSVVGVEEVEPGLVSRYGILEGSAFQDGVFHASRLIEKPAPSETDSNLAFCARYVLDHRIFHHLEAQGAGKDREVQLTDAMQKLLEEQGLLGIKLNGHRYDVGDHKGLLLANLALTEFGCE